MNTEHIDLTSPKKPGWHWWKATPSSPVVEFNVSEMDIKTNKFKNFGGEWHHYPTYNEVMEYRQAYYDLYQRAKANEQNLRTYESALFAFSAFLNHLQTKFFVPKKKIKEFLAKIEKPTQVPPAP